MHTRSTMLISLTALQRHRSESRTVSDETDFPVGSYTFDTNLQKMNTSCTSNPATWQCYPYNTGSPVKFFWIISPSTPYTISSTDNPFAPSFSNLSMTLRDANTTDERLTFSYTMSKTIVPSENITADNRAARCTFDDTILEATLWTRRGANKTEKEVDTGTKFTTWPGDVEVVQKRDAEVGEPRCEDDNGIEIIDVRAGSGECTCEYSNLYLA